MKKSNALALISGGLDSMLAVKMILEQGIYVEGINFYTGFCGDEVTQISCAKKNPRTQAINARWVANKLGIKLNVADVAEEYKDVVLTPKYGYGAHINPCLDCKIFMVKKAKEWALQNGFDFIITGEVLGQRPKSQLKHMLTIVAEDSGARDLLLRPLCARYLAPTLPEREGWVERDSLGDCCGRSRKPQMVLLKKYGITEYAQPSGGCCSLINEHYARRLRDLWRARGKKDYSLNDMVLSKIGRHLRPIPNFKMIIGRDENENNFLMPFRTKFISLHSPCQPGPIVLIDGVFLNADDRELAMRITAHYCKSQEGESVQVALKNNHGPEEIKNVLPLKKEELLSSWFI